MNGSLNMSEAVDRYVTKWEKMGYSDGIPDEIPTRLDQLKKAPSYKNIAIAILKNDVKLLGFSLPKSDWYSVLKSIELQPDRLADEPIQLSLF